jgi:hypothetical protein
VRYTAFALELMGLLIAAFAGLQYLLTAPTAGEVEPGRARLGFSLLAFSVALVIAGAAMLAFGGKGYAVTHGTFWRRRARAVAAERAAHALAAEADTGVQTAGEPAQK